MGKGTIWTFTYDEESSMLIKDEHNIEGNENICRVVETTHMNDGSVQSFPYDWPLKNDDIYFEILDCLCNPIIGSRHNKTFAYIPDAIRWVSKEAFTCKQYRFSKCLLVKGYVTSPGLYPAELAAMYDEYIRENAGYLISKFFNCWCFENYLALVNYIFKVGKPSKQVINTAIKRLSQHTERNGRLSKNGVVLYLLLKDNFHRLYPKAKIAKISAFEKPDNKPESETQNNERLH